MPSEVAHAEVGNVEVHEKGTTEVAELAPTTPCTAPPLPLLEPGGHTPGTTTPPPRSSSPSSDGFSQRWDHLIQAGQDATCPTAAGTSAAGTEADGCKALHPRGGRAQGCLDGTAPPPWERGDALPNPGGLLEPTSVPGMLGASPPAQCPPTATDSVVWPARSPGPVGAGGQVAPGVPASQQAPQAFPAMMYVQIPPAPCSCSNLSDRCIIEGLAASEQTHRRLLRAAHRARSLLCANGSSQTLALELYGSLALCGARPREGGGQDWWQDWPRHYVRTDSDADLVALLRTGIRPSDLVRRLTGRGRFELVSQTSVNKFSTTHFTLRALMEGDSPSEVSLDLTCIDSVPHFERFKGRQEAFRQAFRAARGQLEASNGACGAMAFDAYIYLLKSFSAKVEGNALSGFQATCLGLFALQLHLYELRCCQPTGLVLFECFLRFCCAFFADSHPNRCMQLRSYRYCAIDLSLGGRLLPRFSNKWRCEVYLLGVEVQLQTKINERMNITHSVVPEAVFAAAKKTLGETCSVAHGRCLWS